MGCRRKTKSERELVADINKVFLNFCNKQQCRNCKFNKVEDCRLEYIKELLALNEEEEGNDECSI